MARLRITRLGHGGVLYRSPGEKWLWVDRWSGSPNYTPPPQPPPAGVVAPPHGHFDHVGKDGADVGDRAAAGGTVVCSHEMSIYLASLGVTAVGMNKGGRFEAAGIGLTMVRADHTGGVTIAGSAGGGGCTPRGPGRCRPRGGPDRCGDGDPGPLRHVPDPDRHAGRTPGGDARNGRSAGAGRDLGDLSGPRAF